MFTGLHLDQNPDNLLLAVDDSALAVFQIAAKLANRVENIGVSRFAHFLTGILISTRATACAVRCCLGEMLLGRLPFGTLGLGGWHDDIRFLLFGTAKYGYLLRKSSLFVPPVLPCEFGYKPFHRAVALERVTSPTE